MVLAYATDIDVLVNTLITVKDLLQRGKKETGEMRLFINENKTQYMNANRTQRRERETGTKHNYGLI